MKILVIKSSPHVHGSSNLLAQQFIDGAVAAGHQVDEFDAGHVRIHPCTGCQACGMDGPCAIRDDMGLVREKLLMTDMVVFVTPLYYFGMSAQLKAVVDRFYSFNGELSARHIKSALIAAAWNDDDWTMRDLKAHYETLCRYLNFSNVGEVLGVGCGTVDMTRASRFMQAAYELGKAL